MSNTGRLLLISSPGHGSHELLPSLGILQLSLVCDPLEEELSICTNKDKPYWRGDKRWPKNGKLSKS